MTQLISLGDLIGKGFKAIQDTWRPTLKYTIWFLLAPGIWYALMFGSLLGSFAAGASGGMPAAGPVLTVFWIVSFIAMLVGLFYAWVCLMQYMLAYSKGENMANWKPRNPLSYLPGALWLYVLMCVPMIVAMLVVVLPAIVVRDQNISGLLVALFMLAAMVFIIWLSTAFSQAHLLLLTDEARGVAALKGSLALVNGRWWATFWRLVVPMLVFYILASTIMSAVFMLIFMLGFVFLGGWAAIMGTVGPSAEAARGANVGFGMGGILFIVLSAVIGIGLGLVQAVTQTVFQADVIARLFWSLKHTKQTK